MFLNLHLNGCGLHSGTRGILGNHCPGSCPVKFFLDFSLCTSAFCEVINVIQTNLSEVQKKTEQKLRPETEHWGKYGTERDERIYGTRWLSFLDAFR